MWIVAAIVWKGYVTFGLISIPIRLLVAARGKTVRFHQIHRVCNSRIRQLLFCPVCDRAVERSELAKGYEVGKDRYVLVEDEEIKKIAPPSSQAMEILQFVKLEEIDPIYFEMSYFAVPEQPGRKAYKLLVETMENTRYAALAKVAMHQREYLVALRPRARGLTLHTMYYQDEIRQAAEYGDTGDVEVKEQELRLAEQVVESMAAPFEPQKFRDEYRYRLQALIEAKMEGRAVVAAEQPRRLAPVVDLMEALQKSLATAQKKPAEAPPPERKRAAKKKKAAA
jgi:DNA end-binding protein Ku